MAGDFIYPGEFALLLAWLCLPAAIVVVAVLSFAFARRGFFVPGERTISIFRILVAVVATLVFSIPLWVMLPPRFAAPGFGPGYVVPVFLPSFIAGGVVVALVLLWASLRSNRGKRLVPGA